jgi:hypothetical protein
LDLLSAYPVVFLRSGDSVTRHRYWQFVVK